MKTIVHNCIAMDCVAPEYREIKSAFARGAVDWCFTVGETVFDDERACFSFDTWDRAEALYDGSIEALSAMFPAVIFHCREWAADAAEPDEPSQVWCAGQNVTALTKEQRVVFRDRAFVEYCKRFLRYERTAGEGYSYNARVVEGEERGAAAWGENRFGECEVYYWDSIKSLGCGDFHTVAARSDGRTVATGSNANGQCNVEGFRNADSIHCGRYHTAALKKVGTVLLASNDERFAQCATWRGIIALRSVGDTVIGVKRDGSVLIDGDPMCPCTRDEIREMLPDIKMSFPSDFKSLAAKLDADERRKERARQNGQIKKRRKAPASAVELDENDCIPERAKKARAVKLEEEGITVTYAYADMLRALEREFYVPEPVLPYYAPDAAKYMEKNGVPPAGDNCRRVSGEELHRQLREFFMVCRLCANRSFAGVIVENAAKSSSGKLIKNRTQRISTLRLTRGEDFYELCAKNIDAETIEVNVVPVECTVNKCRGLGGQPESRAVLEEYCSVKLE